MIEPRLHGKEAVLCVLGGQLWPQLGSQLADQPLVAAEHMFCTGGKKLCQEWGFSNKM